MLYLLDTNICIYIIKKRPESVLERFKSFSPGQLGISMITVAELEYGVRKSSSVEKNNIALRKFLTPFNLFEFDHKASTEYGIVRSSLEIKGTPIGPLDTLIAAHALSLSCILVTNNEKEFQRVEGLNVENWV